jgi:hypothetical protein
MGTAERIFEEVRSLPESAAREVLDFVGFLKTRQAPVENAREQARAVLAKYRGRFKAVRFERDELYDR